MNSQSPLDKLHATNAPVRPGFQESLAQRVRTATLYQEQHAQKKSRLPYFLIPTLTLAGAVGVFVVTNTQQTNTWGIAQAQAAISSTVEDFTRALNGNDIIYTTVNSSDNTYTETWQSGTQVLTVINDPSQDKPSNAYLKMQSDASTIRECDYVESEKNCTEYTLVTGFDRAANSTSAPRVEFTPSETNDSLAVITWETNSAVTTNIILDVAAHYPETTDIDASYGSARYTVTLGSRQFEVYAASLNTPAENGYINTITLNLDKDFAQFDEFTVQLMSGATVSPAVRFNEAGDLLETLDTTAQQSLVDTLSRESLTLDARIQNEKWGSAYYNQALLEYLNTNASVSTLNHDENFAHIVYTLEQDVLESSAPIYFAGEYAITVDKTENRATGITFTPANDPSNTQSVAFSNNATSEVFTEGYVDQLMK